MNYTTVMAYLLLFYLKREHMARGSNYDSHKIMNLVYSLVKYILIDMDIVLVYTRLQCLLLRLRSHEERLEEAGGRFFVM
jgi:hypothetical protein